ncbi:polar amino acid transport system substrate-binding protein [Oxalobacteraceae bacterium GrIS 1.11]
MSHHGRILLLSWLLAATQGVVAAPAGALAVAPKVKLASDDWCPYICSAEHRIVGGFLVELAEEILENRGYRLESILLPLNRAILMTEKGAIDGVYAPEIGAKLLMSVTLHVSRACFYTRADSKWRYSGIASLPLVGVIRDYGYDGGPFDAYLASSASRSRLEFNMGATAGETNLRKMLKGRYPVALEHEAVVDYLIKAQALQAGQSVRKAGCLENRLPLLIGIGKNNPAAQELIEAINAGHKNLAASGELRRLKNKYGIED